MTNKERLQANNEKIEEIQRTLNGKVLEANKDMKKLLDGTLEEFDNKVWGLTSLREYQFYKCENLKKIDLTGITEIPQYACYRCIMANDIVVDKHISKVDGYGIGISAYMGGDSSSVFETDVDCYLGDYALYEAPFSVIKGSFTHIGANSLFRLLNLKLVDISIKVSYLNSYTLSDCDSVQSLKINFDNCTATYIPTYFVYGCGGNRENPQDNIFVFDMRKTPITKVNAYSFSGKSSLKIKYFRCFFPKFVKEIGKGILGYSENCVAYFAGNTPATLSNGGLFVNSTDYKIFVPYNSINTYKTATNWVTYTKYIYGWAEENTFEQGATLPTTSAEGLTLTWYIDENMTAQVTSVEDPSKIYYCKGV